MRLVIAEKPSVSQSIAAVIGAKQRGDGYLEGGGYLVSWCLGHLAELAEADTYDKKYAKWNREDLPILPESWRFTVGKDKWKQFDILRTLMRRDDVSEVINACDAGREGELIFRTVYCMRGEKGIKIIAPTPFKKKIEQEKLDPNTKIPMRDADGKVIMEEKEIKIPMYKVVSVFDVAQTEGKPLPTLANDLTGNVRQYAVFMMA